MYLWTTPYCRLYRLLLLSKKIVSGVHSRRLQCSWSNVNLSKPQRFQPGVTLSKRYAIHLLREVRAVEHLLIRSGISPLCSCYTSQFHTSTSHHQQGNDKNKPPGKDVNLALLRFFLVFLLIYSAALTFSTGKVQDIDHENTPFISWNEFVHNLLSKGEVREVIVKPDYKIVQIVLHDDAVIKGKKTEVKSFFMQIHDMKNFEDKLRQAEENLGIKTDTGVPVVIERASGFPFGSALLLITLWLLINSLMRGSSISTGRSMNPFSQMSRARFTLIDPMMGQGRGVKFSDVAGLKEAKVEVMEFVDYLKRPEYYKNLGAKVPKGALLLGPPGCGKTMLAKAVATEANVPFLSMNGSEFIEVIGGLGAARVRDLFKEGKKRAPSIIYIDEIDAIGTRRTGASSTQGAGGERDQTLNQLLVEMDGIATKEGVLMLGSTNRAEVLDKALLRPGRFDRHILLDLPTQEERQEIFEQHMKAITFEHPPSTYSHRLALLTPGFSGADIANICNEAALHAAREKQKAVKQSDLDYAVERVVGGTEKKSHVLSVEERRVIAYHESGHALLGWLLEHTDALLKVTIVPRTNHVLGFAQYLPTDQKLYSKEELFERICMALGGRVAESMVFNRVTTSAQNDLQKVTKMAYSQVKTYGMNETIGLLSFPDDDSHEFSTKPYSRKLGNLIDAEARFLVAQAYKRTEEVLTKNRDKLNKLAHALLEKETLNYDEIVNLIGAPPFEKKRFIEPVEFEVAVNKESGSNSTTATSNADVQEKGRVMK